MGRPVRARVSYASDAGFLTNLVQAVEQDGRQSPEWREKTAGLLRQAAGKLLEAKQPLASIKKRGQQAQEKRVAVAG